MMAFEVNTYNTPFSELPSTPLSAITSPTGSLEVFIRRIIGTSFLRKATLTSKQEIGIVTVWEERRYRQRSSPHWISF